MSITSYDYIINFLPGNLFKGFNGFVVIVVTREAQISAKSRNLRVETRLCSSPTATNKISNFAHIRLP